MKKPKYKFYVTLLDAFQNYLDSSKNYHKFYTSDNPSITEHEFTKNQYQSLIDRINRVSFESVYVEKGTAFNELIDCMVSGNKSEKIEIDDIYCSDKVTDFKVCYKGKTFLFDVDVCKQVFDLCKDALLQQLVQSILPTKYGDVLLYGYVDAITAFAIKDIKTTKRYNAFKFKDGWQHRAYPFCLNQNGIYIEQFDYVVTNFKKVYVETYMYHTEEFTHQLVTHCTKLIEFLEKNKSKITDKKIFALDE